MSRTSNILLIAWAVWFWLLVSTPYAFEDPARQLLLSSSYAYVSLGVICGVLAGSAVGCSFSKRALKAVVVAIWLVGGALTLFLVIPEWAVVALTACGVSPGPLLRNIAYCFGYLPSVHHVLLGISGFLAGTVVTCLTAVCECTGRAANSRRCNLLLAGTSFCFGVCHPIYCLIGCHLGLGREGEAYLAAMLYAIAIFLMMLISGCRRFRSIMPFSIVSFCLGQIAWNLVARCSSTIAMADFLFVPFCALFVVSLVVSGLGALLAWTMTSSTKFVLHATDENESSGDGAIAHMIDEESLSLGFGLTERESQAISLMLQGKTSREAAEMMGVKPSTVRNYLQRTYAKASVSSSSEMRELLCPAVGDDCPLEAEAAMTTPSGHSGWMLAFLPVLAICLGCFFAFGSEGQVLEHAVVLGLGFGLFLCGSLSLTREISCGAGFNLVTSRKLLALSTLISSLLLGVSVLLYVLSGLILSCSLLAVSCCLFACSLVSLSRMIEAELDSNRIQFMGQGDVALSIIGASLLPGYSLGYFCERPFDAFSAVVIVTSLLIFAIFFIAIARYGKGHSSMMSISFASFGVGLGMVAGCVTADRFVEYLLVSADEPFMPGVFTPFASTPVVTTLIALISLVGIAYLAFVGRFSYCPEVSGVIHERIVHYLMARGLSDRESEVVALISEGFTGSQIAVKMHYSLGSVNAMRLAGYRILGIHSKSELDSLLKESVGIER